jgi:hypothetical protein
MKTLLSSVCALLLCFAANATAQEVGELVVGGNMEDENTWNAIQLDKPDVSEYEFNYAENTPAEGKGGCLKVRARVNQEADVFFYQEVTLIAGEEYTVTGAFRDLGANVFQFWASLCYVLEEPQEGAALPENTIVGFNTWSAPAAGLDGTFQDDFSAGTGPTFTLPDSLGGSDGLVTIYFGINIGSWTGGTNIYEFEVLVDEVSIIGPKPQSSSVSGVGIIEGFNLLQNYPNPYGRMPFNPRTTISYSLPRTSTVTLKVYDPTGREMATLAHNERKAAGTYEVSYDAAKLPSGVYLYRLQTEGFVVTKKMLLLK